MSTNGSVDPAIHARVSVLEDAVGNLHSDLAEVRSTMVAGFKELQSAITKKDQTNWSVIFAGCALVGSIYYAAVHPINDDIIRLGNINEKVSNILEKTNDKISSLNEQQSRFDSQLEFLRQEVYQIRDKGSPITQARLAVIENKLGITERLP